MNETDEKVSEEFSSCKDIVRQVMQKFEECRNDDDILIAEVKKIKSFKSSTIIRTRSFIQNNDGDLLPTRPQIAVRRKIREESIRNYFANNSDYLNEWQEISYEIK